MASGELILKWRLLRGATYLTTFYELMDDSFGWNDI